MWLTDMRANSADIKLYIYCLFEKLTTSILWKSGKNYPTLYDASKSFSARGKAHKAVIIITKTIFEFNIAYLWKATVFHNLFTVAKQHFEHHWNISLLISWGVCFVLHLILSSSITINWLTASFLVWSWVQIISTLQVNTIHQNVVSFVGWKSKRASVKFLCMQTQNK